MWLDDEEQTPPSTVSAPAAGAHASADGAPAEEGAQKATTVPPADASIEAVSDVPSRPSTGGQVPAFLGDGVEPEKLVDAPGGSSGAQASEASTAPVCPGNAPSPAGPSASNEQPQQEQPTTEVPQRAASPIPLEEADAVPKKASTPLGGVKPNAQAQHQQPQKTTSKGRATEADAPVVVAPPAVAIEARRTSSPPAGTGGDRAADAPMDVSVARSHMSTASSAATGPGGVSRQRGLVGTVSILTFDRTRRHPPVLNSPRSLLACKHEGLDPPTDFLAKEIKDFILGCRGSKEMAAIKLDHYLQRRDQLVGIVTNRRQKLLDEEASRETHHHHHHHHHTGTAGTAGNDGDGAPGSSDSDSTDVDSHSGGSKCGGSGGADGHSSRGPRRAMLSRKEKALLSVNRMRNAFTRKMEKLEQDRLRTEQLRQDMLEQEQAQRARQADLDRQERVKAALSKRKDDETKQLRVAKEQEVQAKLEAMRVERERTANDLLLREALLKERQYQTKIRQDYEAALHQKELEDRMVERRQQVELELMAQQREAAEKMQQAEALREKLAAQHLAALETKRAESEAKTAESKAKRHRALQLEAQKVEVYAAKAKAVEAQQLKIQQERENYLLHAKLEEAKKEQLRRETLRKVEEDNAAKAQALLENVHEAEARTQQLLADKLHLTERRRVEKELMLDDRLKQQQRIRRVQENHRELVLTKIEEKQMRIAAMQDEKVEDELERRKVHVSILRQTVKKAPARTPGPGEYSVDTSYNALHHREGVKLCTAGRDEKAPEESPGPGQYAALRPRKQVGAKLPPKAKDLDLLTAQVTIHEQKEHAAAAATNRSTSRDRLPSIRRSPSSVARRRSSTAPLVATERPAGVLEQDYADSDEDFERVEPLMMAR